MLTAAFWTGTADRAVKSFAQALLLLWGADAGFDVLSIDMPGALGVAAGAAVLSVLTSIVSAPAGDKGSSSLLPGAS
ncbi:holin [Pseudonocardia sp.]|uniref:holin n=1 Tax=Pseudonocardia sp. TaxID=60912 RepID=UPI003D0CBFBA